MLHIIWNCCIFAKTFIMNPFALRYNSDFFCDRKEELLLLKENALNGRNTLVHSPRRLGKSSLILHLFHKLEKEKQFETVYVDLFATSNINDFIKEFGEAILRKYYFKNLLAGVKKLFAGLQASVSFSSDGMPHLGMGLQGGQVDSGLRELFDFLEKRKKPVIIAFDEFQEVATYPEKAEALIRSFVQRLNNVVFIYSGSSKHILQNMFFGPKQPFFQSSESLVLDKINASEYSKFIEYCFNYGNKKIEKGAIDYLLDFSETHTYYTQSICNQAFYNAGNNFTKEEAINMAQNYLETHKADYAGILNLLPENQRKVIKAIAKEGKVQKPSAMEFLIKHNLPSTSSTMQALNALVEKEMVYKTTNAYKVYDVFFRRFLEKYY